MTIPGIPNWMNAVVSSQLKDPDKDRVESTAHRCFLGSFADLRQLTLIGNKTTEKVPFALTQPVQITSTQYKPSGRGIKAEVIGLRPVGFYGISVRVLDGNVKIINQWKNYPRSKGTYGYIALCSGDKVLQSQALSYTQETIICDPVVALLEQFSFDLKLAERETLSLSDYCLDAIAISLPPTVRVQIGFIPVWEQFRASIEHDDETNWTQVGVAVAVGAVLVAAAAVSAGIADGFILGAMGVAETGAAEVGAIGALNAEGMTGAIDVAYTVLEVDGVAVGEEAGVYVPRGTPTVPQLPPQASSQVLLNLRPIVGDLESLSASQLESLFVEVKK